jgi:hypothetical protein
MVSNDSDWMGKVNNIPFEIKRVLETVLGTASTSKYPSHCLLKACINLKIPFPLSS